MIKNKVQYETTENQIKNLTNILNTSKIVKNMPIEIYDAMVSGMESMLNDMKKERDLFFRNKGKK